MNAFAARASSDFSYLAKWQCDYYLPSVECTACGETTSNEDVWYPTLSLKRNTDRAKFSNDSTVSVAEFEKLKEFVIGSAVKKIRLLPGASLGPVQAKLPKRGTDFLWCGSKPILAISALEKLTKQKIAFTTGSVIPIAQAADREYVALQVPAIALYSRHTIEQLTLVNCKKCGGWELTNVRVNLRGPREYVASRIPENEPLVKVEEGGETIASSRFIDAVESLKLTGIEFRERGLYV